MSQPASHPFWLGLIVTAAVISVPFALRVAILRPAGNRGLVVVMKEAAPDLLGAVPRVARVPFELVTRAGKLIVGLSALLTLAAVASLAIGALEDGLQIGPLRIHETPLSVGIAALVTLWMVFSAVSLAVAGAVWLRTVAATTQKDEAERQADFAILLLVAMIVSLVLLPLSLGVLAVAAIVVAFFAFANEQGPNRVSQPGRLARLGPRCPRFPGAIASAVRSTPALRTSAGWSRPASAPCRVDRDSR